MLTITAYAIITQEQEAEPDTAEADTTEVEMAADTTEDAIDRVIDKKSNKKDNLQAGTCKGLCLMCVCRGRIRRADKPRGRRGCNSRIHLFLLAR